MAGKPKDRFQVLAWHPPGAPQPPNHGYAIIRQVATYWRAAGRYVYNREGGPVGDRIYAASEIDEALAECRRLNGEAP